MNNYYKAVFRMSSPIVMNKHEPMLFDDLVAYCYAQEQKQGAEKQINRLSYKESDLIDFSPMPIVKHRDGYFMASWMMWDDVPLESIDSWKKRWANEHDHLAGFGRQKRKVRINNSYYKSYNVPLGVLDIGKVYFYFQSNDVRRVKYLLNEHIASLGKKRSQGYGAIDRIDISKVQHNPFEDIVRPIPIHPTDLMKLENKGRVAKMMAYRSPYYLPQNKALCFIS